jgi:hypothetical protein
MSERPVTDAAEIAILGYLKNANGPRKTSDVIGNTMVSRQTFRRVIERLHSIGQVARLGAKHYQWLHGDYVGRVEPKNPKREIPVCNGTMQTAGWTPPRMICARSEVLQ